MAQYRIELAGIHKGFGGVSVLKGVSLALKHGEIRALLGENGAGKSTLMKIISGAYQMDEGQISIDGVPVSIKNPMQGKKHGIGVIYQEFTLANDLTVAENIFLEHLSDRKFINWAKLNRKAEDVINKLGFTINPKDMVGNLSVAHKQVVEIAKALSVEAKILILDEPSTVLAPDEIKDLFRVMKRLKKKHVSIIYISHRLHEVFEIADSITVLKDGGLVDTVATTDVSMEGLINMMIGRQLSQMFPPKTQQYGEILFEVKNLTREGVIANISFTVRKGEILGFAGLVGSGRTEVMKAIFGEEPIDEGEIFIEGKKIAIHNTHDAVKYRIGLVPEDRKEEGSILSNSVSVNISLSILDKITNILGFIAFKSERKYCHDMVKKFNIKINSLDTHMEYLSGGNQQKVILAKWFLIKGKVLILDEPTRGIDVGSKIEIYNLIREMSKDMAIIVISSEMMEVIGISHRVAVMREGEISTFLEGNDISEINIMRNSIFIQNEVV